MRFFCFQLFFVLSLTIIAKASANEITKGAKNNQAMPIIRLHGTIVSVLGSDGAIISVNNEAQKYIKNNAVITKGMVLKRTYSNYVLIKTSHGLKKIILSPQKKMSDEVYYDPNLELGHSRKFYQPPSNIILLTKTNNQNKYTDTTLLQIGQTREFFVNDNTIKASNNDNEEFSNLNSELTEGQTRTLYNSPEK